MIRAVLHWRAGHVTTDRARQLAAACEQHPGPNPVEVQIGPRRLRLGVSVDAASREWMEEARQACDPALCIRLAADEPTDQGGTDG